MVLDDDSVTVENEKRHRPLHIMQSSLLLFAFQKQEKDFTTADFTTFANHLTVTFLVITKKIKMKNKNEKIKMKK